MPPETNSRNKRTIAATGIEGLDDVLAGGLRTNRLYLIEGVPGSGKTTLALQFLREGVRLAEPVLYITLSETREELEEVASSHEWSLEGITRVVAGGNHDSRAGARRIGAESR
jgi:circadian clock protein KaiC